MQGGGSASCIFFPAQRWDSSTPPQKKHLGAFRVVMVGLKNVHTLPPPAQSQWVEVYIKPKHIYSFRTFICHHSHSRILVKTYLNSSVLIFHSLRSNNVHSCRDMLIKIVHPRLWGHIEGLDPFAAHHNYYFGDTFVIHLLETDSRGGGIHVGLFQQKRGRIFGDSILANLLQPKLLRAGDHSVRCMKWILNWKTFIPKGSSNSYVVNFSKPITFSFTDNHLCITHKKKSPLP